VIVQRFVAIVRAASMPYCAFLLAWPPFVAGPGLTVTISSNKVKPPDQRQAKMVPRSAKCLPIPRLTIERQKVGSSLGTKPKTLKRQGFPPRDPAFLARGALILDRAAPAGVGPVTAQAQPSLLVREVMVQTRVGGADI